MDTANAPNRNAKEQFTQVSSSRSKIDIVVAQYKENLKWIKKEPFMCHKRFVYTKGSNDVRHPNQQNDDTSVNNDKLITTNVDRNNGDVIEILLPNVGRESHTYLYHIVENYDHLADVTVFLPGSAMDDIKQHKTIEVLTKTIETQSSVFTGLWYHNISKKFYNFEMSSWLGTSTLNQQSLPSNLCEPSSIRPFGRWYNYYFGNLITHLVCFTSTFSVSREHIYHRNKEFYQDLLLTLSTSSNPEIGHFMERAWLAIFHPIPEVCQYYPKYPSPSSSSRHYSSGSSYNHHSADTTDKMLVNDTISNTTITTTTSTKNTLSNLLSKYSKKRSDHTNESNHDESRKDDKIKESNKKSRIDICTSISQS